MEDLFNFAILILSLIILFIALCRRQLFNAALLSVIAESSSHYIIVYNILNMDFYKIIHNALFYISVIYLLLLIIYFFSGIRIYNISNYYFEKAKEVAKENNIKIWEERRLIFVKKKQRIAIKELKHTKMTFREKLSIQKHKIRFIVATIFYFAALIFCLLIFICNFFP